MHMCLCEYIKKHYISMYALTYMFVLILPAPLNSVEPDLSSEQCSVYGGVSLLCTGYIKAGNALAFQI